MKYFVVVKLYLFCVILLSCVGTNFDELSEIIVLILYLHCSSNDSRNFIFSVFLVSIMKCHKTILLA